MEKMDLSDLYHKAYQSYEDGDRSENTIALFREVIERYPESDEARYAEGLLDNLEAKNADDNNIIPEQILKHLKDEPDEKKSWMKNLSVLLISLVAFAMLGFFSWTPDVLFAIILTIAIHETGHILAMKLSGYTNLKILFIPLMGGIASGKPQKESASNNAFISLMGPLVGILSAIISAYLYRSTQNEFFYSYSTIALIVNLFNLMPIYPLDGGHLFNELLFGRYPKLEQGFKICASLALLAAGIKFSDYMLFAFGVLMFAQLKISWDITQVVQSYKKRFDTGRTVDIDSVTFIWNELKGKVPNLHNKVDVKKRVMPLVNVVLRKVEVNSATWRQTVMAFLLYGFTLLVLPVFALLPLVKK